MSAAVSRPGIDPRTWCTNARVDDDDDAIRWDDERGWIVDVTLLGTGLDQEGPFAARLAQGWSGDGAGSYDPPSRDSLVAVVVMGGNPNAVCWIVGRASTPDLAAPTEVNGQSIDEDFAKEHHILVTPHGVQQQIGKEVRIEAQDRATLAGSEVRLQDEEADQSYMRGEDFADAADALADASDDFGQQVLTAFTNLVPVGPPITPVTQVQATAAVGTITAAYAALAVAIAQFKTARQTYLSTVIKGE